MTIHNEHPFQAPEPERNPLRRLRGRLPSPVCLLTAEQAGERAGLTVSSVLVLDGDPGLVLAVIDPLSDLHDVLVRSGRGVLSLLGWSHHNLAEAFGFVAPAPGGPFRMADWTGTDWGPALSGASWAGGRLLDTRPAGWGVEVRLALEHVEIASEPAGPVTEEGPGDEPVVHHRGRYRRLAR